MDTNLLNRETLLRIIESRIQFSHNREELLRNIRIAVGGLTEKIHELALRCEAWERGKVSGDTGSYQFWHSYIIAVLHQVMMTCEQYPLDENEFMDVVAANWHSRYHMFYCHYDDHGHLWALGTNLFGCWRMTSGRHRHGSALLV
jgi:hypothetical protein